MMNDSVQAKNQIIQAVELLIKANVMFRGEHANVSAKITDDTIVLTKRGSISQLSQDSYAVVRLDGTVIEGEVDPVTSEVIEMHTAIYQARPSVGEKWM